MPNTLQIPLLVPFAREQYLRKEETRIRSEALPVRHGDSEVNLHLNAVLGAEELIEIHEVAARRQNAQGATAVAATHHRFAALAWQLKLHHLNCLASLLI